MQPLCLTKQKNDMGNLVSALLKAHDAAIAVNTPDEGTFNFDTPIIKLPEGADVNEINKDACSEFYGVSLERVDSGCYEGWYFINGLCSGMQMRRTKMAEAIAKSLKEDGYTAGVYYAMD